VISTQDWHRHCNEAMNWNKRINSFEVDLIQQFQPLLKDNVSNFSFSIFLLPSFFGKSESFHVRRKRMFHAGTVHIAKEIIN
jgi:hypothetical protein